MNERLYQECLDEISPILVAVFGEEYLREKIRHLSQNIDDEFEELYNIYIINTFGYIFCCVIDPKINCTESGRDIIQQRINEKSDLIGSDLSHDSLIYISKFIYYYALTEGCLGLVKQKESGLPLENNHKIDPKIPLENYVITCFMQSSKYFEVVARGLNVFELNRFLIYALKLNELSKDLLANNSVSKALGSSQVNMLNQIMIEKYAKSNYFKKYFKETLDEQKPKLIRQHVQGMHIGDKSLEQAEQEFKHRVREFERKISRSEDSQPPKVQDNYRKESVYQSSPKSQRNYSNQNEQSNEEAEAAGCLTLIVIAILLVFFIIIILNWA